MLQAHAVCEPFVSIQEEKSPGMDRLKLFIRNDGPDPLRMNVLQREVLPQMDTAGRSVYLQGETMCSATGWFPPADGLRSCGCIGFPAGNGHPAVLLGALDLRCMDIWFELRQEAEGFSVRARFQTDDVPLQPGEIRNLPELVRMKGDSLALLLEEYGRLSGEAMQARVPAKPVFGWCSWYHYYGHETEEDILANARELKQQQVLPPGAVIQIDDGWNRVSGKGPRNWGDWHPGAKFPRGMRAVSDELHAAGFQAGLWLAPFSADAASELAQKHPEWVLQDSVDGLLEEGSNPVRGLDLTHPEVLAFIDATFERVFNEWNFDYVKLDFLMHAMAKGPRFDPSITRTAAMHHALMRIRKIAGERFILCCGSPFGPAVGAADAMRIGFDVGSRWHAPMLPDLWLYGNCSVKPAAYPVIHRQWMNGRWWVNDPDCLVVRGQANRFEPLEFNEHHPGGTVPKEAFGLSEEEAGFWTRLVYAAGTVYILSEVWSELPEDRKQLVLKSMQNPGSPFRMMDTSDPDRLQMCSEDGQFFAVFNISDEAVVPALPSGWGSGLYAEVFSGECLRIKSAERALPEMPPHSGRIWEWREKR
jgi:alpha-galactosidase